MSADAVSIVAELAGPECRCGKPKAPGQTFCQRCYRSLPARLQAPLYRLIDQGYFEAYRVASLHLAAVEAGDTHD